MTLRLGDIYPMQLCSAVKKNEVVTFLRTANHYVEQNKPDSETQMLQVLNHMYSLDLSL